MYEQRSLEDLLPGLESYAKQVGEQGEEIRHLASKRSQQILRNELEFIPPFPERQLINVSKTEKAFPMTMVYEHSRQNGDTGEYMYFNQNQQQEWNDRFHMNKNVAYPHHQQQQPQWKDPFHSKNVAAYSDQHQQPQWKDFFHSNNDNAAYPPGEQKFDDEYQKRVNLELPPASLEGSNLHERATYMASDSVENCPEVRGRRPSRRSQQPRFSKKPVAEVGFNNGLNIKDDELGRAISSRGNCVTASAGDTGDFADFADFAEREAENDRQAMSDRAAIWESETEGLESMRAPLLPAAHPRSQCEVDIYAARIKLVVKEQNARGIQLNGETPLSQQSLKFSAHAYDTSLLTRLSRINDTATQTRRKDREILASNGEVASEYSATFSRSPGPSGTDDNWMSRWDPRKPQFGGAEYSPVQFQPLLAQYAVRTSSSRPVDNGGVSYARQTNSSGGSDYMLANSTMTTCPLNRHGLDGHSMDVIDGLEMTRIISPSELVDKDHLLQAPPPLPPPRYIEDVAEGHDSSSDWQQLDPEPFGSHRHLAPIQPKVTVSMQEQPDSRICMSRYFISGPEESILSRIQMPAPRLTTSWSNHGHTATISTVSGLDGSYGMTDKFDPLIDF